MSKNNHKKAVKQRQRPARRKAKQRTPRPQVSVMPFMGGELIKISGLTQEEATRLSAQFSMNPNTVSWAEQGDEFKPSMVLWRSDFTDKDPFFRLSFSPDETKARMAHNIMGVELQDCDESPDTIQDIIAPSGEKYCVGTWGAFMVDATPEQVKNVKDFLAETNPFMK